MTEISKTWAFAAAYSSNSSVSAWLATNANNS